MSGGRGWLSALSLVALCFGSGVGAAVSGREPWGDDPAAVLLTETPPLVRYLPWRSGWRWDGVSDGMSGQGVLRWRCARGCFLALALRPSQSLLYDPGRGRLVLGEARPGVSLVRFSWRRGRWLMGDYGVSLGTVLRVGVAGDGGAGVARRWRMTPLNARLRPVPALRGVAWESGRWGVYLSRRVLDVYQYRLRYRADVWALDALGECDVPGREREGYRCDGSGVWYGRGVVDESGHPRHGVVLPGVAEERVLAGRWRGGRWSLAAYGGQLSWRVAAPGMEMAPSSGYPGAPEFAAWGGRWRGSWGQGALVRASDGWAWTAGGRAWGGVWRVWRYGRSYANPYAAGPVARPWDRRRDHQGVRWGRVDGGWRVQGWSRADGVLPGVSLRYLWRGGVRQGLHWRGRLRVARRWGGEVGYRRVELGGSVRWQREWGQWRASLGGTRQGQEGTVAWRWRLGVGWEKSWGSRRFSLGLVGFWRNEAALGRLSVGDGDRVRFSWRGRRGRLGVWIGRDGRRALWWSWWGQSQSKP